MAQHRLPTTRARRAATVGALAVGSLSLAAFAPGAAFAGDASTGGSIDGPTFGDGDPTTNDSNGDGKVDTCDPLVDLDLDSQDDEVVDAELLCVNDGLLDLG